MGKVSQMSMALVEPYIKEEGQPPEHRACLKKDIQADRAVKLTSPK